MIEEIWKDIPQYEKLYQVSNFGRVRSLMFINNICNKERDKPHIMSLGQRSGYSVIILRKSGKRKSFQVHRLVALCFIPTNDINLFIDHIDCNRKNNIVSNLRWCTQKENVGFSVHKLIRPKKKYRVSNTGEKYICFKNGKYRLSMKKIKNNNGIDKTFKNIEEAIVVKEELMNKYAEYYFQ